VVIHRVDRHLRSDIAVLDGIPITSVRRTLLDLSGRKHPRAERALDHALRQQLVELSGLWSLYEEEWTRGRRGIAILRSRLIDRTPGAAPGESELEDMLATIIRKSGLPRPRYQYPIALGFGPVHLDAAYPDARLAIECDGYAWHMDRVAFERDRQRDMELQALGWRVLRFTWSKLKWEQTYVSDHIRHHLNMPL
jgi:very-short-patch-repair endonuclease